MHHSSAASRRDLLLGEVIDRGRQAVFAAQVHELAERNRALTQLADHLGRELRESLETLATCTGSLAEQLGGQLDESTRSRLAGIADYARRASRLVEALRTIE